MDTVLKKIAAKIGGQQVIEAMGSKLSGSEFTSLLLELFKVRASSITPAQLLEGYQKNRFVKPSSLDPVSSLEFELSWLKKAREHGFAPLTLSSVAPLGTCSVFNTVSQHKVLSASRGTEVVADATNVLVLHAASELQGKIIDRNLIKRYCAVHRHVRSQFFDNPDFTPHFGIFCMASVGYDRGNYSFELGQLQEHIATILKLLDVSFPNHKVSVTFFLKSAGSSFLERLKEHNQVWSHLSVDYQEDQHNHYYETIQFKLFVEINNQKIDIADGGVVNWTQQLLGNQKHRAFISGVGIELAQKLLS
jgi:hypothetical protein